MVRASTPGNPSTWDTCPKCGHMNLKRYGDQKAHMTERVVNGDVDDFEIDWTTAEPLGAWDMECLNCGNKWTVETDEYIEGGNNDG